MAQALGRDVQALGVQARTHAAAGQVVQGGAASLAQEAVVMLVDMAGLAAGHFNHLREFDPSPSWCE